MLPRLLGKVDFRIMVITGLMCFVVSCMLDIHLTAQSVGHDFFWSQLVRGAGQMLVFSSGQPVLFTAVEPSSVMLLGGEPLGERHIWWNFVSSSVDRIEQAKADWKAGRIPLPPNDHDDIIPLPEDPPGARIK